MLYRTILFFLISCIPIIAVPQERTIEITGLKIYSAEELTKTLSLDRYNTGKMSATDAIASIEDFYKNNGYILVKTYVVTNEEKQLTLFVDEGRIGKILLLRTDTLHLFWLRYKFKMENRIFNINQMKNNMEYLQKVRGYRDATYKLKPTKNYNDSLFQLDRTLNIPVIGDAMLLFFDKFGPRFDLEINLSKRYRKSESESLDEGVTEGEHKELKSSPFKEFLNRFDYGLTIHYNDGFIPKVRYDHPNSVADGDDYSASFSLGIMYGLDGKFSKAPWVTFIRFDQNYMFTPTFRDFFTPSMRANLYYSRSSRNDLGILNYNYLLINSMFSPGITLLRMFRIYTGYGIEIIRFDQSEYDPNVPPQAYIEKRTDIYNYLEIGLTLDLFPIRIGDPLKHTVQIAYDYYFMLTSFNQFKIATNYSLELTDMSIYTIRFQYNRAWMRPPFHHEISVSSQVFKGFMGRSYHTRGNSALSNEFIVSVYRDYLYAGVYFDATTFVGSGYDLHGYQYGIVGGPTMRLLILDQIEFYLYFGWDYLFSKRQSQRNFTFNLYKKW